MSTAVINFKEPNIRKAHSGSPLTYDNKILGMVDGGAKLVDGKPLIWAIPASDFNKLYVKGNQPARNMTTCTAEGTSKYLYSGVRSDNPFLTASEAEQAKLLSIPLDIESSQGEKLELLHNYTMSFAEVYETLYEEEQAQLQSKFEEETMKVLMNTIVHFYSEAATGVSIMIPDQCKLVTTTDAYGTLNTTTSPGGLVTMSVYVSAGKSTEDAVNAMNAFQEFIRPPNKEFEPMTMETIKQFDSYYGLKYEYKGKVGNNVKTITYANMTVDGPNFLAVSVNTSDWPAVNTDSNEKMYFYLMEVCSNLSNFPFY